MSCSRGRRLLRRSEPFRSRPEADLCQAVGSSVSLLCFALCPMRQALPRVLRAQGARACSVPGRPLLPAESPLRRCFLPAYPAGSRPGNRPASAEGAWSPAGAAAQETPAVPRGGSLSSAGAVSSLPRSVRRGRSVCFASCQDPKRAQKPCCLHQVSIT